MSWQFDGDTSDFATPGEAIQKAEEYLNYNDLGRAIQALIQAVRLLSDAAREKQC